MEKLNTKICDKCRKVIPANATYFEIQGKKRKLHYCSLECRNTHTNDKRIGRKIM